MCDAMFSAYYRLESSAMLDDRSANKKHKWKAWQESSMNYDDGQTQEVEEERD